MKVDPGFNTTLLSTTLVTLSCLCVVELSPSDVLHDSSRIRVISSAVRGMLPHNRLGRQLFNHLKVYSGNKHPHESQQPKKLEF